MCIYIYIHIHACPADVTYYISCIYYYNALRSTPTSRAAAAAETGLVADKWGQH